MSESTFRCKIHSQEFDVFLGEQRYFLISIECVAVFAAIAIFFCVNWGIVYEKQTAALS